MAIENGSEVRSQGSGTNDQVISLPSQRTKRQIVVGWHGGDLGMRLIAHLQRMEGVDVVAPEWFPAKNNNPNASRCPCSACRSPLLAVRRPSGGE